MSVSAYEQSDVLVLENAWVKVSIDRVSGVLLSLFDKRTHTELLKGGLWVELFGEKAPGYFASSSLRGEEGEAAILLSGIEWSSRVGWSLECKLREGSCALYVALTLFSRDDLRELEVGVRADVENFAPVVLVKDRDSAISPFVRSKFWIYPLQTIRLRGSLLPTGLARNPAVGDGDAAFVRSLREIQLAFARDMPNCRIESKLKDGSLLSAIADASPTQPIRFSRDPLNDTLDSVRVLTREGEVVASFDELHEVNAHAQIADTWWKPEPEDHANRADDELVRLEEDHSRTRPFDVFERNILLRLALAPSRAPIAYLRLAFLRMREQKWMEAASFVNESLIHNSANPIAWWAKHVCLKKLGEEDPESLANVHYLAPHEPLLKAEAFLQQPDSQSKLLDTYGHNPQPFLEVAEFLLQAGLFEDLYFWLSEGLRRTEDPMFSVLLAWLHKRGGQHVEAEMFLERARKSGTPIQPIRLGERAAAGSLGFPVPPL